MNKLEIICDAVDKVLRNFPELKKLFEDAETD